MPGRPRVPAAPHGAPEVRAALLGLGLRPSRNLGQSFLTDPFVADIEAALVEVPPGTPVVEVGGGLGLLTEALLRRGLGPLRVIERDRRLAAHLRTTFGDRIELVEGDARRYDFTAREAVVGNLPFSVASVLLTRAFEAEVPLIVALLQREVGHRYAAHPGGREFGRPAVQAALYGSVEEFAPVPASAFEPVPEVDGLIVRFRARSGPLPVPSRRELEMVVRRLFASRRKQLGNLLPAVAGGTARAAEKAAAAGWPADWARRRPEELGPEEFFALARALHRPPVGPA